MDNFIDSKYSPDWISSYCIVEIGTKNENYENLIIVNDGRVVSYDIDENDKGIS